MSTFNTAELNPVPQVETPGVIPVPVSELPTTSVEDLVQEKPNEGLVGAEQSVPAVPSVSEPVSVVPDGASSVKFSVGYEPEMESESSPSAIVASKAQGVPPQD